MWLSNEKTPINFEPAFSSFEGEKKKEKRKRTYKNIDTMA